MKKSAYFIVAAAAFAGVFGALRVDRYLDKSANHPTAAPSFFSDSPSLDVIPTRYSENLASPPDFRSAAHAVLPSVVSVDRYDEVADFFGDSQGVRETGTGSGVIIDTSGIIVTNNHVVQNANQVKVRLNGSTTPISAKVLGTDPQTDLAVLKIDTKTPLAPIELGDSSKVEVGQWVMAIGNPLNYSGTLSVGVVSSLGRTLTTEGSVLTDAIQTDAAINQGNSGGALTDAQGRLIGINSAIASNSGGGSIGIGFAIPVNRVRSVAKDIVELGHARHAGITGVRFASRRYDGILTDEDSRARLSERFGHDLPDHGVIVTEVANGTGSTAGIQSLDVIMDVDGQGVNSGNAVQQVLNDKKPGDTVSIKVWSKGNVKDLRVKLGELAAE
jgi:serine protease Do